MTPTPATAIMECDDLLDPTVRGPGVPFTADLCTGGNVTFVAVTITRNSSNSPRVRTHVQSCAELESLRARVPYMAGYEFSPSTLLRAAALQSKSTRSVAAYAVLWKATIPPRVQIPPGKLSLQPVPIGAEPRAPIRGISTCSA